MKFLIYIIQRLSGITISAALLYFAVNGNIGAARLYIFLTWLVLICYAFTLFTNTKLKASSYLVHEPALVSWLIALSFVGVLVWHGWWPTAVASMINQLFFSCIQHDIRKTTNK